MQGMCNKYLGSVLVYPAKNGFHLAFIRTAIVAAVAALAASVAIKKSNIASNQKEATMAAVG